MNPQEMNEAMEFIIASQARLAAAQEQDRQDRVELEKRHDSWMRRLAELHVRQTDLLNYQSERMDRLDRNHEDFKRQFLHLLNMILDRLPPVAH